MRPIQPLPNVMKMLGNKRYNLKDTDRDGVADIVDCNPHNPREQGIIHQAGKWLAGKVGAEKIKKRIAQHEAASDIIRKKATAAGYREREQQEVKIAKEREKIRAERKIKYMKSGGIWGSILAQTPKPTMTPRYRTKTKRKKRKKSKGKRSRQVVSHTPTLNDLPRFRF